MPRPFVHPIPPQQALSRVVDIRDDYHQSSTSTSSMLRIQALLNPSAIKEEADDHITTHSTAFSPPPTPALTSTSSTSSFSPRMDTPQAASPAKRQKLVKDAPVFIKGEVQGPVHYAPFESSEDAITLPQHLRDELVQQHKRFNIYPSGSEGDGLIGDFVRRIPYSSDKKQFVSRNAFEGFDVFQYTFVVPDDPNKKEHTVMWDYSTGLVRITAFFKACKYSKTTPAKSLAANHGLKDLSLSVTGGALVAQGYWLPYGCARAICLTFAYPIRWALTPIFGPSFMRECLAPEHPGFGRFKIDSEVMRCARMALEGTKNVEKIPRSVPESEEQAQQSVGRPVFKLGSPFDDAVTHTSKGGSRYLPFSVLTSPAISPKTTTFEQAYSSRWTSINRSASPSPPPNTPYGPLDSSLLTRRTSPTTQTPAAESTKPASNKPAKRPRLNSLSDDDDDYDDDDDEGSAYSPASATSSDSSSSGQGSDEPPNRHVLRPTAPHDGRGSPDTAASRAVTPAVPTGRKSKKYTMEDYRAARLLLQISERG